MSEYHDEEQVEAIKRWLRKYGLSVVVGVFLGLALMYGIQFWKQNTLKKEALASATYEGILFNLNRGNPEEAMKEALQLKQEMPGTIYGTVAQLLLAKQAVEAHRYEEAKSYLKEMIAKGKMPVYQQLAQLELARILGEEQDFKNAFLALTPLRDVAYASLVEEVKGDLYMAQGKPTEAGAAYEKALRLGSKEPEQEGVLLMKLSEVNRPMPAGGVS